GHDVAYLLLYMDDNLLTASSIEFLHRIIASLHQEFSMTGLGPLNYFLGISVSRSTRGMFLCQIKSLVGALQYLTFTRHDLSYAVQQVCLYMHDHREPHLATLKRFLRYICGTLDYGLHMYSSSNSSLVAYSHVDWAGCLNTRRFTLRYCVFLGNNLLSWSSKRQYTLSRSSSEAGYRGVAKAVVETFWLRNFLRELHSPLHSASIVYYDNASADMYAFCMFTKGLPSTLFDAFQTNLSVLRPPAPTAERWAVPIKEGEVHLGSV
ncbi:ribonuclease H-like domain-containing protein, partial [Tanacetum coccineum]